ncbi:MAG TPA: hypothetical protein VL997_01290, partial [Dyella sp.]|nr:hypothetical protein [Dyella sp.]
MVPKRQMECIPPDIVRALSHGTCGEPFRWLGPHPHGDAWYVATTAHGAEAVEVILEPEGTVWPARPLT